MSPIQHTPSDVSSERQVAHPDPNKWPAIGMGLVVTLILPMILLAVVWAQPEPPTSSWSDESERLGVHPSEIYLGEIAYRNNCAICHGQDAEGVPRLGKPLRNSAYVQEHTDEELLYVIANGRLPSDPENTTGVMMPARAGRALKDEWLRRVVCYLRAIQDPGQPTVSIDDWIIATGGDSGEQVAGIVGSEAGIGHELFVASCSACHGSSGEGIPGLGKALDASPFVDSKSDDELITFIKMGRPIWDGANTTGLDMPPKGGNPAITDAQLTEIVKYIRSLHE